MEHQGLPDLRRSIVDALTMSALTQITIIILGSFLTPGPTENMVHTPIPQAYNDPSLPSYKMRQYFTNSYSAPGDPDKASKQIYQLSNLADPPLYFPLGQDAMGILESKAKVYIEAAQKWRSWSDDVNRE